MRNTLLNAVAAASLLMAASPALAKGGTWVAVVPVQNSTGMTLFGINDTNVTTGSYLDASGNDHGFIGPFDGKDYTSFDDPGGATEPRGINDGSITDGYDTGTLDEWYRTAKGKLTAITMKGTQLTQLAQEINKAGVFAGDYTNTSGDYVGYLGKKSKYTSDIKLSISNTGYAGRAIDTAGDLGGWYLDSSGTMHGFLIMGKKATSIDYPDAVYTVVEGLNDNGLLTGQWEDSSGVIQGFVYDIKAKKFTDINYPGSTLTQVWGINNNDVIAVSSSAGSFAYCMKKKNCPKGDAGVANTLHVNAKYTPAAP
ncbi:MAG TPA: hypothetical protein VHX61_14240 [Rhizomicrobium sp.]|jgi:hypothetical protein|nr:hypothetical protein [Rhizomicrobium sp.]